jgi:hypothetical protein
MTKATRPKSYGLAPFGLERLDLIECNSVREIKDEKTERALNELVRGLSRTGA